MYRLQRSFVVPQNKNPVEEDTRLLQSFHNILNLVASIYYEFSYFFKLSSIRHRPAYHKALTIGTMANTEMAAADYFLIIF